jgi:hypothetical protein
MPKITVQFTIKEMNEMLPSAIRKNLESLITISESNGIDREEATQIFTPMFFREFINIINSEKFKIKNNKENQENVKMS